MGSYQRKHCSGIYPARLLYCMANPYGLSPAGCWGSHTSCHCNMVTDHPIEKRRLGYNRDMKKLIAIALSGLLMLLLSGCSVPQDRYRYPCQDPANWKNAECNPPICESSGTCTKDLIEGYEVVQNG